MRSSRSQQIRSKLPHPIVDADGHMLELTPVLSDYVYQVGGADARDLFDRTMVGAAETGNAATIGGKTWFEMDLEEKKEAWFSAPPWWAMPTRSALDRATATVPRVLNDRMDELGMDYAVLYTTTGLAFDLIEPQEQKLIVVRAINAYAADIYMPYSYRMTPAAIVPMDTPQIAIRGDGVRCKRVGPEDDNAAGSGGEAHREISGRAPGIREVHPEDGRYRH